MISFESRGEFTRTDKFLRKMTNNSLYSKLEPYAREGVSALAAATPVEEGTTAGAWGYEISVSGGSARISWTNSNSNDGVQIAVIIQYGHGTGTGGYVAGRDYINPAMRPIFDKIADSVWKEVTSA